MIGRTEWHRRLRRTPLLDYLNEQGLQFGFALIRDPEQVPFHFFYTSNLSLERQLLLAEPFDLRFPYAAWEDIEVAYRLSRRGLRIVYEARARVEHDHATDLDRFAARQERAGYCAVVFRHLHPELGSFVGVGRGGAATAPLAARSPAARRAGPGLAIAPGEHAPALGIGLPVPLHSGTPARMARARGGRARGGQR
ncbi:MAG: hypothetical protein M5U13_00300 [Thermoanaerobaculia bacterium]|nr:hypothetical protein [Thermoanaerobaculia bacterium]